MSSDADTRRRAEFVAARRAEMRVTTEDFEVVGGVADKLRGDASPDLGPRDRLFVRFDVPGTTGAAVWLDELRQSPDPVALVRRRAALLMALHVPLRRAMDDVGPSILNEAVPLDRRAPFFARAEQRIEQAAERHDPDEGRASSTVREALAAYRVVVSLVANEHRLDVSLEPR